MKYIPYYFALCQGLLFKLFFFKTKVYYEDDDKRNKQIIGSAIIITNHRTFMDAIVICLKYFFRRLNFVIADFTEYYKEKKTFLARLLLTIAKFFVILFAGNIFVDRRGYNLGFIEKCKRVTAKGRVLLIFPEGDYNKHLYEPGKFSPGYVIVAVKTNTKIIPVVNDFNYGIFKRVHLMIGNSIDLSAYGSEDITKANIEEINNEIHNIFLNLFYKLKRKKAERFSKKYEFISPKPGNVIRIFVGTHYHYGVYLNSDEVIQFGRAVNTADESAVVNSVSLSEFCGNKIPEVRVLKRFEKRFARKLSDVEKYAKSCLGQGGYSITENNCLDFANRVTLKI